jgi:formylglycine-generating enzyme required for sulfatase activity
MIAILQPGTMLREQYRVLRLLGQGGMGAVYLVEHIGLGKQYALKQMLLHSTPKLEQAFQREARLLAHLSHPVLPSVTDYFSIPEGLFLVMAYVEGSDLVALLHQNGRAFAWETVAPWAGQLLDVLHYLHNRAEPIVHRDIKPNNIKILPNGQLKLLDFGLAKSSWQELSQAAGGSSVLGHTPGYAPPEQLAGKSTPQSDLYAVGATLYVLLTGRVPADANSRSSDLWARQPDPLRPLPELAPQVPRHVARAIMSSLALAAPERPVSAKAFAQQLQLGPAAPVKPAAAEKRKPEPAAPVKPAAAVKTTPEPAAETKQPETPPGDGTNRRKAAGWGWWLVAGGVALFGILFLIYYSHLMYFIKFQLINNENVSNLRNIINVVTSPEVDSTLTRPSDGMLMVYVPAGCFKMGSADGDSDEKPVHEVCLDAYWLDQTEVTNKQYRSCVAAGACQQSGDDSDSRFNGEQQPVVGVRWYDASLYCKWAGGQLPSEAQWEYAARGPQNNVYPWGNAAPNNRLANFDSNVGKTTAVGSYTAGASWVGALDMAGNVWEWVRDGYDSNYYQNSPKDNPYFDNGNGTKVLRGGGWVSSSNGVRASNRYRYNPSDSSSDFGFRCSAFP